MKKLIIYISFITFFLAGCTSSGPTEEAVIEVHDIAMAKMGDIHKAKKELRAIADASEDKELKDNIANTILALTKADDGMMLWMQDWKVPENKEEKKKYLISEMEKIEKVKDDIFQSLEKASTIINSSNEK